MSKLPIFKRFHCVGKSQAKTRVVFQVKTEARIVLSFSLNNGLRFHFDSVTCLNYPFLKFSYCSESEAKTQVVFQAKTQAKIFLLKWAPGTLASASSSSSSSPLLPGSPHSSPGPTAQIASGMYLFAGFG